MPELFPVLDKLGVARDPEDWDVRINGVATGAESRIPEDCTVLVLRRVKLAKPFTVTVVVENEERAIGLPFEPGQRWTVGKVLRHLGIDTADWRVRALRREKGRRFIVVSGTPADLSSELSDGAKVVLVSPLPADVSPTSQFKLFRIGTRPGKHLRRVKPVVLRCGEKDGKVLIGT